MPRCEAQKLRTSFPASDRVRRWTTNSPLKEVFFFGIHNKEKKNIILRAKAAGFV
jgi:hypothetical protein